MASFFGEVIEPLSRSFVTDGEETFFENKFTIKVESKESNEIKCGYQFLIIACGKILQEFSSAYLIPESSKIIGKYHIVPKDIEDKSSVEIKMSAVLFEISKNTLLFVCGKLHHDYFSVKLLSNLKPWIEAVDQTVILTAESMATFKPRGSQQPFLRSLHTRTCSMKSQVPNLEIPNTLGGLPASVMSWCQAMKKSAVVYVVYTESSYLDSTIAEPLLQLMKALYFLDISVSSSLNKLQNIVNSNVLQHSNLYL